MATLAKIIRVLIASDYEMTRDGIRTLLQHRTPDISFVANAENVADAAEQFRRARPDVVLLDASAPAPHALRCVGTIARESQTPRVVVLTNITDARFVRSMLAAGALGYVLKQSSTDRLIAAIRKASVNRRFVDPLLSDTITELLTETPTTRTSQLSQREQDVLNGIARGLSNRQLADQLNLSTKTVETYRGRLYQKLHLHDRAELVNYAIALGLLSAT